MLIFKYQNNVLQHSENLTRSSYSSVTIRFDTLNKIKECLLEQMMVDIKKSGALAIWTLRPSVSKFVEQAIAEKLERGKDERPRSPLNSQPSISPQGGGSA